MRCRERGFTLLEILVVLSLLAVLLVLLSGALLGANRAVSKRSEEHTSELQSQ